MRRIGNRIATPLFALLLAVSLVFGATSAVAEAPSAGACPTSPPWAGTCTSDEHCTEKCRFYGGDPIGDCQDEGPAAGCCLCAF